MGLPLGFMLKLGACREIKGILGLPRCSGAWDIMIFSLLIPVMGFPMGFMLKHESIL